MTGAAQMIATALAVPAFGALLVGLVGWLTDEDEHTGGNDKRESVTILATIVTFAVVAGQLLPQVLEAARPSWTLFEVVPGVPLGPHPAPEPR